MSSMLAVVMHGVGDIRLEEQPIPDIGPNDALLRVAACGVCGSDLDRMYKKGPHKLPLICGHEFSAIVEKVGEDVNSVRPGDHVTVPPMIPCFECTPCAKGEYSLCENYDYYGSRRNGAYAEYVAGPATALLRVPKKLDVRAAAMVDPAAIALHAIMKTNLTVGTKVAVFGGGGPIGLFAIQWAKLMGASTITAFEVTDEKAKLAKSAGATDVVTAIGSVTEAVEERFDVVVETSGAKNVPSEAISVLARKGEVVLVGIPNTDIVIEDESWAHLMRFEGSVIGSWNSFAAPFPGKAWATTVEKMISGDLKWEFMVTHELGLDGVAETIRKMSSREIHSAKVLIEPSKTTR
ncbi:galactitol-1-phosphate 5-dehydrogenase [Gleimia hominis]|uniref:galactitol-1-phosphate 5-dehydrogenase n=1 Tax=Gleimia hominis TaxID=595468 RepID=UPI000C806650|nr:galactitol-1-phosphate 5-dehydrogenase [Gleimia hominis]WIK63829.1 galactitol-1-phosphate 5-dehydrogenase [Gleimia hominis]